MTSSSFVANNWHWIIGAVGAGGILLWQQIKAGGNSGDLTPTQAVTLMNKHKAQVIDVRDATAFATGHINAAKNVPLAQIKDAKGLPSNKATPLIVVCATGSQASRAVSELKKLGYEQAQSLGGGLKAWREANLPTSKA